MEKKLRDAKDGRHFVQQKLGLSGQEWNQQEKFHEFGATVPNPEQNYNLHY